MSLPCPYPVCYAEELAAEAPYPILCVAVDGAIHYANRASRPLLQLWKSHCGREIPDPIHDAIQRAVRGRERVQLEKSWGGDPWVVDVVPHAVEPWAQLYATAAPPPFEAQDERRRRRQESLAFDQAPGLIFIKDGENRVIRVNRQAAATLGLTPEDLEGKLTSDFHPEEAQSYLSDDREVIETGKPKLGIIEPYQGLFSEKHWMKTDKFPYFDEKGNIVGVLVHAIDITTLVEVEQHLTERIRLLESSNRELNEFATRASHDLQEPLRMVSSYLHLLSKRYRPSLGEDGADFIRFAVEGAGRMRAQLAILQEYSQLGLGSGPLLEPVECGAALALAIANSKTEIATSGAELRYPSLPRVMGSRVQITRLFQNLLSNSIKFCDSERPVIDLEVERRPEEWLFTWRDNGVGVSPELRDRVFGPFQREGMGHSGYGMGLAICRRIVEGHGGRIWIEPRPSSGATFCFTLPAA